MIYQSQIFNFRLHFALDHREFQYNRSILNFLEVSGSIGGIFEILEVLIGAISGYLTSYFFKMELKHDLERTQSNYEKVILKINSLQKKVERLNKEKKRSEEQKENEEIIVSEVEDIVKPDTSFKYSNIDDLILKFQMSSSAASVNNRNKSMVLNPIKQFYFILKCLHKYNSL